MVVFPNCKVNLGLHVVNKRPDGYHNIETVFYPLNWCDILEVIENRRGAEPFLMSLTGLGVDGKPENNLVYRAWQLIREKRTLPAIKVHLHKIIPMGAGLGGGSSNAAAFINLMNNLFELGFSEAERIEIAAKLGSDCAFFIKNQPILAQGKGDQFSPLKVDLSDYYVLVVYPAIHSDTKSAYEGLVPAKPSYSLETIFASQGVGLWKDRLVNDFEPSLFKKYPEIKSLKQELYNGGALYACMSGSGSSVFGVFEKEPVIRLHGSYSSFLQKPATKIL